MKRSDLSPHPKGKLWRTGEADLTETSINGYKKK